LDTLDNFAKEPGYELKAALTRALAQGGQRVKESVEVLAALFTSEPASALLPKVRASLFPATAAVPSRARG
jgi:hypothetical protein